MAATDNTVHLKPETFAALKAEAQRRHVDADELADELVRDKVQSTELEPGYLDEALDALDGLSEEMPEIDAVELVRRGRQELEYRALKWQWS